MMETVDRNPINKYKHYKNNTHICLGDIFGGYKYYKITR